MSINPSPDLMEHILRVIQMHCQARQDTDEGANKYAIEEACELALNTRNDTLDEIAAYAKLEKIFPDEFRTARATLARP